jgi:hypothetical protein
MSLKNTTSLETSSSNNEEKQPAANAWHLWAKEENDKYTTTADSSFIEPHSPKMFHSSQQKKKLEQRENIDPDEEAQSNIISASPPPPQCFCKKPAHLSFTLEHGSILECSNHGSNKTTTSK